MFKIMKFKVVNKIVKAINPDLAKAHTNQNQCALYNDVLGAKDKNIFQNWIQRLKTSKNQRGFHFLSCCNHFLVFCQLRSIVFKYSVNSLSDPAVRAVHLSYIHIHGEIIHEPGLIRMKGEGCFELPALTTVSSAKQLWCCNNTNVSVSTCPDLFSNRLDSQ